VNAEARFERSEESSIVHCVDEYKNMDNVKRGQRSQEITFDFISAEAGIHRHAQVIPGHRYRIESWGKHVRSASPVELSLGVGLSSGEDWQAASVEWHPWDETGQDVWVHTQVNVRASGETLTIFLKGYHPFAEQGGATLLMICAWWTWGNNRPVSNHILSFHSFPAIILV
jgi:uncharacterized protein (DUF2164 family)